MKRTARALSLILAAQLILLTFAAAIPAFATEGITGPVIVDGMATEIIPYSDPQSLSYSNADSEILRYVVYVETDYDTDLDSKPDLVKAIVQVPRAAAEGAYDAATIYEARPYIAGTSVNTVSRSSSSGFIESAMMIQHPKRTTSQVMSSVEVAEEIAKPSDWYYRFGNSGSWYYDNFRTYDYYLVRGFAVVQSAGLGTYGSEGVECFGTYMEAAAFASVIDWICGRRTAYADPAGTIATVADWSNGKVGMSGRSYAGTLCYELAAMNVEGLETIIPVAGISSTYGYSNSQGLSIYSSYDYTSYLMGYCASRFYSGHNDSAAASVFAKYLAYCYDAQNTLKGDYGSYWLDREFSHYRGFSASALIVHGLNDTNVRTKQFDLMRDAFVESGCTVKAILHQNDHMTPATIADYTDIMIGDYTYSEITNLWFSHYLLDVDNGIEYMPDFTVQSNVDGEFYGTSEWKGQDTLTLTAPAGSTTKTINARGASSKALDAANNVRSGSSSNGYVWKYEVTDRPLTVDGPVRLDLNIKITSSTSTSTPSPLCAILVDYCSTSFSYYDPGRNHLPTVATGQKSVQVSGVFDFDICTWQMNGSGRTKVISVGRMDLHNPGSGYDPRTAVTEAFSNSNTYDYTLYIDPNYYTVLPGHTLEVYVVPYANDANSSMNTNASYTIRLDLTKSSVTIPVTHDSFDHPLLPGDVNCDGVISSVDLRMMKQYLAGLLSDEDIDMTAADVNADGETNAKDVRALKQLMVS